MIKIFDKTVNSEQPCYPLSSEKVDVGKFFVGQFNEVTGNVDVFWADSLQYHATILTSCIFDGEKIYYKEITDHPLLLNTPLKEKVGAYFRANGVSVTLD